MDQVAVTAASGMRARMDALDMLANNLANSTTGGFKLDREFYTLFSASDAAQSGSAGSSASLPQVKTQWTDFSQGTLQATGNPLDLALAGKGFFTVNGPTGPLYTRNGSFQLSASGELTTREGYPVGHGRQQNYSGPAAGADHGGHRRHGRAERPDPRPDRRGRFSGSDRSGKLGGNYFVNTSKTAKPVPAADTAVKQAQIEASNVSPADSAVRLVGVMRQFEMLQKAISLSADMDKKALDEVARVSGVKDEENQ